MRVLIVGAGIAGLSLALCLQRRGHTPVIIEKTPELRAGGYMIDFVDPGYAAAERLGLLPALAQIHYPIARLSFVDAQGKLRFALPYPGLRRLFDNRHFNFVRGDLEHLLYQQIRDTVEVRFGTTLVGCVDGANEIQAQLSDGSSASFDLLVGADGVHSSVRRLVFGPTERFLRFLGCAAAAYIIDHPEGIAVPPGAFTTLTVPGRQVAVYPIREGRLATLFLYRTPKAPADHSPAAACAALQQVYGGLDWVVPALLRAAETVPDLYFDAVSQVVMPQLHKGRVALVGDAGSCVSLLAGQGASLALGEAEALAGELTQSADVPAALARYSARVQPEVAQRQAAGRRMATWFVPASALQLAIRDGITRFTLWPGVRLLMKRTLAAGGKL